jgi:hypothetical protein
VVRGTAKPEGLLPDVGKMHHPEAVSIYREAEREDKALSSKQQAASRKLKSELRKHLGDWPNLSKEASGLRGKNLSTSWTPTLGALFMDVLIS